MNKKEHFILYIIAYLMFVIANLTYFHFSNWFLIALFMSFFLIDPDIDFLFRPILDHRDGITHSIILPIIFYWAFHPYINMGMSLEFGIILFFPIFVHLLGDFRISHLVTDKTGGTWQISLFNKRLGKWGSIIWVITNEILIIIYVWCII